MFKSLKKWYKEVDPFELLAIVFIVIGIIAIIVIFFTSSFDEFFDKDKHSINEYAELIGGVVGSLWALAGVLLFYASLASQQKDIEEQRNLLVRQIDEVVKQTDEFRKQSDIQAKQQYENTYFQLLRFHNEIITSIVLEISDVDFTTGTNKIRQINGRKSFVEYYDIYKRFFNTQLEILMTGELTVPIIQRIVDNSYRQFFDEYQADLGHYFRNLYNILYFIDNLQDEEKSKFYLELLHAQLSNFEIALLYFHCASSNNKDFKELLEKYELLSTIPDDEIISMSKRLYNPRAFGKDDFDSEDEGFGFGGGFGNDFESDINNNFNFDFGSSGKNSENESGMDSLELSFSENDILSKFASLSKKKGGAESFEDSFNEYSFEDSLDLSDNSLENQKSIENSNEKSFESNSLLDKLKGLSSNIKIEDNDFDNFDNFEDKTSFESTDNDLMSLGSYKDFENNLNSNDLNNDDLYSEDLYKDDLNNDDVNILDSLSAKLQNLSNKNLINNNDNDSLNDFDIDSDIKLDSTFTEFNKPTPNKSDLLNKLKSINELEKSIDLSINKNVIGDNEFSNSKNNFNNFSNLSNLEKLSKEHSLNEYDDELSDFLSIQSFDFNLENEVNDEVINENKLLEQEQFVKSLDTENSNLINSDYTDINLNLELDTKENIIEENLPKPNIDTLEKAEKVKLKDLSKLIQKRR